MSSPSPLDRHSTSARPPDLLVIARALWAGKWWIAATTAVAIALGTIYSANIQPRYTARTVLSLEGMARQVMSFDKSNENPVVDVKYLETEAEVLRSRGLVETLVEKLSLLDDPEFNPTLLPPAFPSVDWALARLERLAGVEAAPQPDPKDVLPVTISRTLHAISAQPIYDTYLVEVSAETDSPEKSAEMANTLARLYIGARRKASLEENEKGSDWLTERVAELKTALEAAELKVSEFRASSEVTSPEALDSLNVQLKSLRERHANSQAQIALGESRLALLDSVLTSEPTAAVAADPVLSQRIGIGGAEASGNVEGGAERLRLARIEADRIEAETDRERRVAEATATTIADLETRVGRQSQEIIQLRQLEREVNANAGIYEFALNRLKQLSVERGIERSPVRVLSKAEPPLGPSSPGFGVVAGLSMVLGGFVGVATILLRQGVQDSFRTPEELERLSSIPVLGQVLELPTSRRPLVMKHIASTEVSPFSESIRNLRTSVLTMTGAKRSVIVLTSAMPGEGKTTLTLALARSMSTLGKTVLVIEADMRGGMVRKYLRSREDGPGLIAAITDQVPIPELVTEDEALGADVLLSETSHHNAGDLFARPDFGRVLAEARQSYDITIVDTAPTLLVPDVKLIAPHADLLLMAVRWNHTTKWQLADAVRELQVANCVIGGLVLSRTDPKGMTRFGYGDRRGLLAAYRSGYYD